MQSAADTVMIDRATPIGQMIDGYLKSQVDMDDHVIHLLFSANRWEAASVVPDLSLPSQYTLAQLTPHPHV